MVYDALQNRHNNETDYAKRLLLSDDLGKVTFSKFLNRDKSKNYFAVDNFYDDERVKGYYSSAENLEAAYFATDHLIPHLEIRTETVGDRELLRYKRLRSKIEMRRCIVEILDSLKSNGVDQSHIDVAMNQFRKHEDREKAEVANYIIDAYEKLGGDAIRNTGFLKARIDSLLNGNSKESNKNKMFSKAVRDAIAPLWDKKECPLEEALQSIQDVFNIYGITGTVKFATLEKYGGVVRQKGKEKKGWVKFFKFDPDEKFD